MLKTKYLLLTLGVAAGMLAPPIYTARAEGCPELKIIFARGSGGERWVDQNYLAFKSALETKLDTTAIEYEFEDLDYPAIGMNMDNFWAVLGAYFGAGDTYEFGASVDDGVAKLVREVNDKCPDTKYVIAGYSQGAMVVSKALHSLNADKVIYAATFGDPKLYLPEGKAELAAQIPGTSEKNWSNTGTIPAACRGENLSDYRVYVPDCYAYEGMLGSYRPYEPVAFASKVGTWCNKRDIFCSSHFSLSSHTSYVADGLYEDAARLIFSKVAAAFGVKNNYTSPHDTAILIDSTGSMSGLIEQYKSEALRLAEQTLAAGGRVALYDYRDLKDPYSPVKHCDFENCTLEAVRAGLEEITTDDGGDTPESLLSASLTVMRELNWRLGSTKSLVVLTDAGYHAPDWDGTEFIDVVKLSKQIDPVSFYVITTDEMVGEYEELAAATGGRVVTSASDLGELTDYIMERFDSLPRVEELGVEDASGVERPWLTISEVEDVSDTEVRVKYETSGTRVLVAINDAVVGAAEDGAITIGGLDRSVENTLVLVPLTDDTRGNSVALVLPALVGYGADGDTSSVGAQDNATIPKAPNTGGH